LLHRDEDVTDMNEEMPCGAEITNRTQVESEEKEGTGNDEKMSDEKNMSVGQKV
jgi:hypothetical protein